MKQTLMDSKGDKRCMLHHHLKTQSVFEEGGRQCFSVTLQ